MTTTNEWTTTGRPMSRLSRRIWGGIGQRILDSGALDGTLYKPGQSADETARLSEYDLRWAYYLNDALYGRLYRAGLHAYDMPVDWNPIPAVVAFYVANTLSGALTVQATNDPDNTDALAAAVTANCKRSSSRICHRVRASCKRWGWAMNGWRGCSCRSSRRLPRRGCMTSSGNYSAFQTRSTRTW